MTKKRTSQTVWACQYCGKTFPTHAEAFAHEGSVHGHASARGGLKRRVAHRKISSRCKHCGGPHTTSQHASHGYGSFARTHKG